MKQMWLWVLMAIALLALMCWAILPAHGATQRAQWGLDSHVQQAILAEQPRVLIVPLAAVNCGAKPMYAKVRVKEGRVPQMDRGTWFLPVMRGDRLGWRGWLEIQVRC